MVRLKFFVELNYGVVGQPADFIFNIHASRTQCQAVVAEDLRISQDVPVSLFFDAAHGNRYARLQANVGELNVRY
jgi:hypothetical protein